MTNLPIVLKGGSSELKKINPTYIESTPVVIEQLCHCHIYSEITQQRQKKLNGYNTDF